MPHKRPYNKVALTREPKVPPFNHIFIAIPRDYLYILWKTKQLPEAEDTRRLKAKHKQIDEAIEQLRHTNSIIERILWQTFGEV